MIAIKRCGWVNLKNPLYIDYHDKEWGIAQHNDNKLFELLILEGSQAGLSWEMILAKRQNYRKAFDNFDPTKVAKYDDTKFSKLIMNAGIVRNKLKIKSAIKNALVFLDIQNKYGSFDKFIWQYVNYQPIVNSYKTIDELPTKTKLSDTISKDLKKWV